MDNVPPGVPPEVVAEFEQALEAELDEWYAAHLAAYREEEPKPKQEKSNGGGS